MNHIHVELSTVRLFHGRWCYTNLYDYCDFSSKLFVVCVRRYHSNTFKELLLLLLEDLKTVARATLEAKRSRLCSGSTLKPTSCDCDAPTSALFLSLTHKLVFCRTVEVDVLRFSEACRV